MYLIKNNKKMHFCRILFYISKKMLVYLQVATKLQTS